MNEFALRLRQLRQERKLRQKDMAEKLGITESAYGYYEQGRREPPYETLQKLADFFDVSLDFLTGRSDDRSPTKQINTKSENKSSSPPVTNDRTEYLMNAVRSGDITKVVDILDSLDQLIYEKNDETYILDGTKKKVIVNYMKDLLIPSMVKKAEEKEKNDDQ